jgi:hypothetical protein
MYAPRPVSWVLALAFGGLLCAGDLAVVKTERDLNKRAELAMANADSAVDAARKDWEAGKEDQARTAVGDIQASVKLACDSLKQTGKPARNNKYYKRVELSMRELLRRLDGLHTDAPYDDRGSVEQVQKRVQDLHDQILTDIMSKRK